MSLTEITNAVDALSADELAELVAFIRERDNAAWDQPWAGPSRTAATRGRRMSGRD